MYQRNQQEESSDPLPSKGQQNSSTNSVPSWTKDKKILYTNNRNDCNNNIKILKANNADDSQRQQSTRNADDKESSSSCKSQTAYHATTSNNLVVGHYELKRTLGKGNFSTVKLAQHKITNHNVAIKVVKTSVLSNDNLMKINREIDVLKKIGKHNHIVRLYQVIKTKRYFMLVTEYCANGELYDYLVEKGRLTEAQSCNYFLQMLSAVEYLHDHYIVHRDLKAENLLLTDNYKVIKIADFGFANYYRQGKHLSTWCGSPPYAAPELFRGLQYVGPPVDIWSLGVILYVSVCGSLPFDGHNLVYLKSRVLSGKYRIPYFMSTECESLIRGMLRLDPDRRYSIRQIRTHTWTMKHSEALSKKEDSIFMDTTAGISATSKTAINEKSAASNNMSARSLDKNSPNNRGQSLDLEDDKSIAKNSQDVKLNEDASMLCLTNSSTEDKSQINFKSSGKKQSILQNFVDIEMANAVSNMSLDSNNSSMSVSQIETTNNSSGNSTMGGSNKSRPDTASSMTRNLSKENSIDDQIIEFMVDNLKVARSQSPIRQSIANNKYDDLHAIYKLIKVQPKIMFESQATKKFKIPSLPLISLNKHQAANKPSITAGFVNAVSNNYSYSPKERREQTCFNYNLANDNSSKNQSDTPKETSPFDNNGPLNLTTLRNTEDRKKSDDKSWQVPPQLFLTPPADSRCQQTSVTGGNVVNGDKSSPVNTESVQPESDLSEDGSPKNVNQIRNGFTLPARHSFDSTANSSDSNNKLTLQDGTKKSLWDSSILDTLNNSTPMHRDRAQTNAAVVSTNQAMPNYLNMMNNQDGTNSNTIQIAQDLAQITTNLPQIGQMSRNTDNLNQGLLLMQLNPLALSNAVTQSSMLTQFNAEEAMKLQAACPIKFTPNNLMNQNFNNVANLTFQNNITNMGIPNSSLLDPNGLVSGLERRASDGQASYSSLTTRNDSINNQTFLGQSCQETTGGFISTSSNQLSHNLNRSLFQKQNDQHQAQIQNCDSNNNILTQSQDVNIKATNYVMNTNSVITSNIMNYSDLTREQQIQMNPLDLTTNSNIANEIGCRISQEQLDKTPSQRSHSTTGASIVLNNCLPSSTSTSPRSSLAMTNKEFQKAHNSNAIQIPFGQVSPSSISLSGGGPGHLLNRRKRHSLETESRSHYYQVQQQHINAGACQNSYNYSTIGTSFKTQYPANSHIGQLRNFAQSFTYKKLMKKQSPTTKAASQGPS